MVFFDLYNTFKVRDLTTLEIIVMLTEKYCLFNQSSISTE